ncbi:GSCOCG00001130001-RA-CDS [Cotesia congregata]|nr:GSCOCG00001130001-RA-CDS [Cotesia congregata]
MLDEDFCPCSSPDLWKEALDCQDLTETQALDDIIQENSDNELVEETRDDSFDDSDATTAGSDDDVVPNSHNNSKAKSPSKSTSPSTSIRSSQLVTPVQVERKISQVQNNNNVRQEYASRNRAMNQIVIQVLIKDHCKVHL